MMGYEWLALTAVVAAVLGALVGRRLGMSGSQNVIDMHKAMADTIRADLEAERNQHWKQLSEMTGRYTEMAQRSARAETLLNRFNDLPSRPADSPKAMSIRIDEPEVELNVAGTQRL